jgi:hypothetical protein
MATKAQRRPGKLTQLFTAQADILTAEMGSKAQEDAGDRRDKALAKLTPQEREDMEAICLALAAMCKRKPA